MARKLQDKQIDSKEARRRLKASNKPYWTRVERGKVHLGYRRLAEGAGSWIVRHYLGGQSYQLEKIGIADDYSDADGNVILNFDQATTAARARMAVRAESTSGDSKKPWTVQEAMDAYLGKLKPKAARDARYKVNALILPKLGKLEIASLHVRQLQSWFDGLAKTPPRARTAKGGSASQQRFRKVDLNDPDVLRRRQSTANRVLTIFKAAMNNAARLKMVKPKGDWCLVPPHENVDLPRVRYLKPAEATRLMNACEPDFRKLVQAALLTGCRYGELVRLKAGDFDNDEKLLAVNITKTGKSRHVILTAEGVAFFKALTLGLDPDALILPKANGKPWGDSHQIRLMKDACKAARINPPIGFHILRHTWASLAIKGKVPMIVVASNLGHTSTRMTEKHYAHLDKEFEREEINRGAPKFGIKVKSNVVGMNRSGK